MRLSEFKIVRPLQGIVTMMGMASQCAAEGDLCQATVSLGYCETLAQRL
ncbi:hypothetical protein AB0O86_25805 [Streptomyces hirsutus]